MTVTTGGPPVGDPAVVAAPPPVVTPPAVAGVPKIASDAGFTVQTFGPNVVTGTNWFIRDGTAVKQSDGSMLLVSTDGYNALAMSELSTATGTTT